MMTGTMIVLIMVGGAIAIYLVIFVALLLGQAAEYRQARAAFLRAWDRNDFYVTLKRPWNEDHFIEIVFTDGNSERRLVTDLDGNPKTAIHWKESDKGLNRPGRRACRNLTEYTAQIVTMARLEGKLDTDETGADGFGAATSGP